MPKGFRHSEETKQKLREARAKRTISEETKRKMSEAHKGRPVPIERRKRISAALVGHPHYPKTKQGSESISRFMKTKIKEKNNFWKGGRFKKGGYVYVICKEHPNSDKNGYMLEHRIIMENIIGRYLSPEEVVHHINKRRDDNAPVNLTLFPSVGEHSRHHAQRQKKIS